MTKRLAPTDARCTPTRNLLTVDGRPTQNPQGPEPNRQYNAYHIGQSTHDRRVSQCVSPQVARNKSARLSRVNQGKEEKKGKLQIFLV